MTILHEPRHAGEFILSEANGKRSRENVTIASGQVLGAGAVLGKLTSGGHYAAFDNDLSDGTQTALAVLIAPVDASAGAVPAAVIARDAEVNGDMLQWLTSGDVAAGIAELLAVGIVVR